MIPTVYLRSSSMSTWNDYCQLAYYITYGLGYTDKANIKAEMGTVFHKVLECLALIKLAIQQGKSSIKDDVLGDFTFSEKDLYKISTLADKTVASINKHRSFKQTYKWDCTLKNNKREGQDIIKEILNKVFDYYKNKSKNEWDTFAKYTIENWIFILKEYNNGEYDPTKLNIVSPEQKFNYTIEEDWAKYEYDLGDRIISGNLSIQGTIDLIYQINKTKFALDFKTGQRKNWGTGKKKDFNSLKEDIQLKLYYYSIHKVLKEHAIMNIFYIRDGGPFTLDFEEDDLPNILDDIRITFEELKNCEMPKPRTPERSEINCTQWCTFYRNKFSKEDNLCMCLRIEEDIKEKGIDWVNKNRINPDHTFTYQDPGE